MDIKLLTKQLLEYRDKMEKDHEWGQYKDCFRGTCQSITKELSKYLEGLGYHPKRVQGYYVGAGPEYFPDTSDWEMDDIEEFNDSWYANGEIAEGLEFPHWWLEIGNFIIDLTEDQFHPGEEDDYRVGIYAKPDDDYRPL